MTLSKALCLMVLLVGAGSLAACETIGPMFGMYKNQLEAIVGVAVAGTYNVLITKDGKTLVTETWTCTTDGKQLTGCHKTAGQTLSTDVTPKTPIK